MKYQYIENKTAAQTIIFLHGWCCEPNDFKAQIKYFKKRYSILSPNYSTFILDRSGKQSHSYLQSITHAVASCIAKHNIKNFVLVGHSMGGVIALLLSNIVKIQLHALIIIDTTMSLPISAVNKGFISQLESDSSTEHLKHIIQQKMINQTYDDLTRMKIKIVEMLQFWQQAPNKFVKLLGEAYKVDKIAGLEDLTIPTLYVAAEPPSEDIKVIYKANPNIQVTHIKSGHFIMLNAPNNLNTAIQHFLIKEKI